MVFFWSCLLWVQSNYTRWPQLFNQRVIFTTTTITTTTIIIIKFQLFWKLNCTQSMLSKWKNVRKSFSNMQTTIDWFSKNIYIYWLNVNLTFLGNPFFLSMDIGNYMLVCLNSVSLITWVHNGWNQCELFMKRCVPSCERICLFIQNGRSLHLFLYKYMS